MNHRILNIDEKLDRLLVDVAVIKTTVGQHSSELSDLKRQLKPVFFHVSGIQWGLKLLAGLIGVGTLIVGTISLWK